MDSFFCPILRTFNSSRKGDGVDTTPIINNTLAAGIKTSFGGLCGYLVGRFVLPSLDPVTTAVAGAVFIGTSLLWNPVESRISRTICDSDLPPLAKEVLEVANWALKQSVQAVTTATVATSLGFPITVVSVAAAFNVATVVVGRISVGIIHKLSATFLDGGGQSLIQDTMTLLNVVPAAYAGARVITALGFPVGVVASTQSLLLFVSLIKVSRLVGYPMFQ